MDQDQFWQLIDAVHNESAGNMDRKCDLLHNRLEQLDERDLRDFINLFDMVDAKAYSWPLWGAAYVLNGGCSDDSFHDFRATLISFGRMTFERALSDPESLADLQLSELKDICYEGFQYVKNDVAQKRLAELPEREFPFPEEPSGQAWEEESVYDLFPGLAKKYSALESERAPETPDKPWWKFW